MLCGGRCGTREERATDCFLKGTAKTGFTGRLSFPGSAGNGAVQRGVGCFVRDVAMWLGSGRSGVAGVRGGAAGHAKVSPGVLYAEEGVPGDLRWDAGTWMQETWAGSLWLGTQRRPTALRGELLSLCASAADGILFPRRLPRLGRGKE